MAQTELVEALANFPVINETSLRLEQARAVVAEIAADLPNDLGPLTSFLESIKLSDADLMAGIVAFIATAIPARGWVKKAATDGKVTVNEHLGIASRAVLMSTGAVMFESAFAHDPTTAVSAATMPVAFVKCVHDVVTAVKSGELHPKGNLRKKEYWWKVLRAGVETTVALVVIPKLNLLLVAANPVDAVAAEVGTVMMMVANYDAVSELLSGK